MYSLGVDIGSTASKGIILDELGKVVSSSIIFSGTGTSGPSRMLNQLFSNVGLTRDEMDAVVVTGYGRNSFEGADKQISELSCHSRGVHHLLPNARTIIDIGGQDVKTLKLDQAGRLANFVMNDKCAQEQAGSLMLWPRYWKWTSMTWLNFQKKPQKKYLSAAHVPFLQNLR